MPRNNGVYTNPGWVNGMSPNINATEMNAISDTLENVGVANGGTGRTSNTSNSVLVGNGTSAVKNISSANGALYSTGAGTEPQFGVLPVAQGGTGQTSISNLRNSLGLGTGTGALAVANGGTGKTTNTANAVLVGNGTNAVKNVASANGAMYATSANGEPRFGVLPIAQGGTGQTTVAGVRNALGLGNTTGVLPIANGGSGMSGSTWENVNTGGGIVSGNVRKWGNVVTVRLQTDQLDSDELVYQANCIPSGYRPPNVTTIVFAGANHSTTGQSDTTRGVMIGWIGTDGSVVTCAPYQGSAKGHYYGTVTYVLG